MSVVSCRQGAWMNPSTPMGQNATPAHLERRGRRASLTQRAGIGGRDGLHDVLAATEGTLDCG